MGFLFLNALASFQDRPIPARPSLPGTRGNGEKTPERGWAPRVIHPKKQDNPQGGLTAATKKVWVQIPAIFERAWGSLSKKLH